MSTLYDAHGPVSTQNTVINPRHWLWTSETKLPLKTWHGLKWNRIVMAWKREPDLISSTSSQSQFKSSNIWIIYSRSTTAIPSASICSSPRITYIISPLQQKQRQPSSWHLPGLRETHTQTHLFLLSIFCSVSWPVYHELCQATCMANTAVKQPATKLNRAELYLWSGERVYFRYGLFVVCMCGSVSLPTAAWNGNHPVGKITVY